MQHQNKWTWNVHQPRGPADTVAPSTTSSTCHNFWPYIQRLMMRRVWECVGLISIMLEHVVPFSNPAYTALIGQLLYQSMKMLFKWRQLSVGTTPNMFLLKKNQRCGWKIRGLETLQLRCILKGFALDMMSHVYLCNFLFFPLQCSEDVNRKWVSSCCRQLHDHLWSDT